jgi:hypothetical protein
LPWVSGLICKCPDDQFPESSSNLANDWIQLVWLRPLLCLSLLAHSFSLLQEEGSKLAIGCAAYSSWLCIRVGTLMLRSERQPLPNRRGGRRVPIWKHGIQ